jgi:hypothetical protein
MLRATGTVLEAYGISIEQAKTGNGKPAAPTTNPATAAPSGQQQ